MAEILHEDAQFRFVKLTQGYNDYTNRFDQFLARFGQQGDNVMLSHVNMISEPEMFFLSVEEMDELCNAWISYQNDMHERAEAEAQRLQKVEAEAFKLAESVPGLNVQQHTDSYWQLTMPEVDSWFREATTPDDLLEAVQEAQEDYQEFQQELERIHAVMAEVEQITKDYPAIKVSSSAGVCDRKIWYVNMETPQFSSNYCSTPDELLETVKRAQQRFIEHQNQLIKQND